MGSKFVRSQLDASLSFVIRENQHTHAHVLQAKPSPSLTVLLTLASDVLALLCAGGVASFLWLFVNNSINAELFFELWPLLGLFVLAYVFARLYVGGMPPAEELKRLFYVNTSVFGVVLAVLFLTKTADVHSRGVFVLAWFLAVFFVPLFRGLLRFWFARFAWWGVPVIVLGAGRAAELFVKRLLANPALGFKPVACLDDNAGLHGFSVHGVPVLGGLDLAAGLASKFGVKHAVVAMPSLNPESLQRVVSLQAGVFRHLTIIPNLMGGVSAGLSTRDFGGMVGLYSRRNLLITSNRVLKRVLDLLLLIPIGLIALPLIALATIGIVLVSPGNPFYFQSREGLGGKSIKVWKLRTMFKNADELLKEHLASNAAAKAEWEQFYKLKRDPRILPVVGSLLRKLSLDELPQLFNILKGEMSFVGPRPFPVYHLEGFDAEFRSLRCSVVPGLTGLWQVSARSDGDLAVQKDLDSYYIHNWSLWLDVYLIARTPFAVLFPKGAY